MHNERAAPARQAIKWKRGGSGTCNSMLTMTKPNNIVQLNCIEHSEGVQIMEAAAQCRLLHLKSINKRRRSRERGKTRCQAKEAVAVAESVAVAAF